MFDALVDMGYNMGYAGLTSSAFFSSLNAGKYADAVSVITTTRATVNGQPNRGLKARREAQKKHFLAEGLPGIDNSKTVEATAETVPDATNNPVIRKNQQKSGSGESVKKDFTETNNTNNEGFRDPKKKYPKKDWLGEPDTHRLARNEKIDQTIIPIKESARMRGVVTGSGNKWDQPPIPYNSLYPFNNTRVSESGHVEEWDDTKDNERIHRYHRTGTFEEIDVNGTRVCRIVGDDFEILERNGYVLVKGSCNVTIMGKMTAILMCWGITMYGLVVIIMLMLLAVQIWYLVQIQKSKAQTYSTKAMQSTSKAVL
jgi:hypothetical protein